MTISISVSVNGNYKVPVKVQHGEETPEIKTISGRGADGPVTMFIPHYHGETSVTKIEVGPEVEDHGEAEAS